MATFRYRAIGPSGDVQTGMMDAATEAEVVAHLQRQGSMPLRAEQTERESWLSALWHTEFATGPSLRQQETADIMRELATMLSAGQDLDHAFRYLHETAPNARVRAMAAGLRDIIRDGSPLADALARYPRGFSRMHVALVRAGEASGQLAPTLSRLADLLERQKRLATSVASALIYPCLLIVVAIGAITLLLTEVLPQFVPLFDQSGAQLPASTQFLIASGAFVSQNGAFMLLGVQFRDMGLKSNEGVEPNLKASFTSEGKPIGQLETNAEQFGFFNALPEKAQRALLEGAVDSPKQSSDQFKSMLTAWQHGDVKAIATSFNHDLAASPELRDALLSKRNANWTRWIEERMKKPGAVMIAVGAGHLAGKGSVVDLLQRDGLHVHRIQ